jgi:hypothetical protein
MRVIEKTVFTFDELSDTAKEKARAWLRRCEEGDTYFSEHVIDDAKTIGAIFGIDIDKVYFSGFYSQGSGACFVGYYSYNKQWKKELNNYAPNDKNVFSIGERLQAVQKKHFYKLGATCKHRGHYSHSGCMSVDVEHKNDRCRDIGDSESDITDLLREFADWIYKNLENAYEWENSDEVIDEKIVCNEYEFYENGERV